jgi:hypothetical protein
MKRLFFQAPCPIISIYYIRSTRKAIESVTLTLNNKLKQNQLFICNRKIRVKAN